MMNLLPSIKEILNEVKNNPKKFREKKSSKKASNSKERGIKYKETELERKERVRDFMTPIYQPIGLGKKR